MPHIPKKETCQAEAENFARAVQLVLASKKLPQLIEAFESNKENKFHEILGTIPGITDDVKEKMKKGAFKNTTVTFTWF